MNQGSLRQKGCFAPILTCFLHLRALLAQLGQGAPGARFEGIGLQPRAASLKKLLRFAPQTVMQTNLTAQVLQLSHLLMGIESLVHPSEP